MTSDSDVGNLERDSHDAGKEELMLWGRPVGTTRAVPVVLTNRLQALRYTIMWVEILASAIQAFIGYSTKIPLSSMFVLIFDLSEMVSAYLSALTLLGFLFGSLVIPVRSVPPSIRGCRMYGQPSYTLCECASVCVCELTPRTKAVFPRLDVYECHHVHVCSRATMRCVRGAAKHHRDGHFRCRLLVAIIRIHLDEGLRHLRFLRDAGAHWLCRP